MLVTRDTVTEQLAACIESKRTVAAIVSWAYEASAKVGKYLYNSESVNDFETPSVRI